MSESKYKDIIDRPYHKNSKRKPMERIMRAAQFAPFAALTGYEESIYETGRETDLKVILDENQKDDINYKLSYLLDFADENIACRITYFVADKSKDGGEYVTVCDCIYKYDSIKKTVITRNGTEIFVDDIIKVQF